MKARKLVAAATVAGCAVLGSAGVAGALEAPDANDTVNGITIKVGGLLSAVLGSVPQAPDVAVPAPEVPQVPQPDVQYSTSGISVRVGTVQASVGVPATPKLPAAADVAVPDPTGHVSLLRVYVMSGVETAKGMATAFHADGTKAFESYSASTTKAIVAGLELAGLGPIQVTISQKASEAWTQFEMNRDFVTRTIELTI